MDARCEEQCCRDNAERAAATDDPVTLHSLGESKSGQRDCLRVSEEEMNYGKLIAKLHLGCKAVDVERRINWLHF